VCPYIGPEDVDHHIPVVDQNPLRSRKALDAEGMDSLLSQAAVDVVCDCPNLTLRAARAEHQIIGHGGELPDVEHDHILGFFVERRGGDGERFTLGLQDDRVPPDRFWSELYKIRRKQAITRPRSFPGEYAVGCPMRRSRMAAGTKR
jgi:hypothetical protein